MPVLITTKGAIDANSYLTVTEADTYHSDRGHTAWSDATETEREVALIKATEFIDANYVFRSVRNSSDQALENPRYGEDELQTKLKSATALLALTFLTVDPYAIQTEERTIKLKEALEGVGSKEVEYDDNTRDPYPFVTSMLRGLATLRFDQVGTITLVRP